MCGATTPTPLRASIEQKYLDRFLDRISVEDECWRWTGTKRHPLGYGGFMLGKRFEQAHRVSYRLFVGEIEPGLHLDHLCRNPWCVRPAHLDPVTSRVNTLRGVGTSAVNAVKSHCIHGHPLFGDNLRVNSRGHRVCRTCDRAIQRRYYERKAA